MGFDDFMHHAGDFISGAQASALKNINSGRLGRAHRFARQNPD
jgi:hypothetical protein